MMHSKRQQDRNLGEPDRKGKLQKLTGSFLQNEHLKSSCSGAEFRVLCPVLKVDSVIGKAGSLTSEIEQQTGATVGIRELVPGCDERVIVISFNKENEIGTEENKEGNDNKEDSNEKNSNEYVKDAVIEGKDAITAENLKSEKGSLSLQTALLLIFDRMAEGEKKTEGGNKEEKISSPFVLRILVPSDQVGCILGKGGCVIKQMSSASGAQIRIIPRDKIPPCVLASDELVQITGKLDAVRKALQSVAMQILGNSSHCPDSFPANLIVTSCNLQGESHPRLEGFPRSNRSLGGSHDVDYHSVAHPIISRFREGGIPGRMKPAQEFLSFRLLCPADRIGALIGKGGQVIKTVQQDTGCDVKVLEGVPDSEDHVVIVAGPVHPDDRISPVQDAVLRVQSRIARAGSESKEQGVMARLLVSSNQIGCLLGKGGSVIAEMRKFSGAHIHVLPKDLIPKCASEDEEVVQINGEFEAVQEALVQITTRLQHYFFAEEPNLAFLDQPLYPPQYFGRRELSPPGMYSNYGPPFHKFDSFGIPQRHGGFHPSHEHRGTLMYDVHRFGGPTHTADRRHWDPLGLLEGSGPGLLDYAGGPQRRVSGYVGSDHPADIIPSTTIEVVVPRSVVPEICGEDGECLKQICEFSDAKITITEPKPGAVETSIVIDGTPEQTHAAQSLIQAFVISET